MNQEMMFGDNFRFPTPQKRPVVHGRIGKPSLNPGYRGTSTDPRRFKQNTSKIRSVYNYIGNDGLNTSIKLIRDHLTNIGLSTDIIDVQLLTIKSKLDSKSFFFTLSTVDAENKASKSRRPQNVVVRQYRVPKLKIPCIERIHIGIIILNIAKVGTPQLSSAQHCVIRHFE